MQIKIRDRFLRKQDIAEMMGTSPRLATAILAKHGLHPIDLGYGRGRGPRWLESAVLAVMQDLHIQAQPKTAEATEQKIGKLPEISLADMRPSEIWDLLTGDHLVQ